MKIKISGHMEKYKIMKKSQHSLETTTHKSVVKGVFWDQHAHRWSWCSKLHVLGNLKSSGEVPSLNKLSFL